MKNEKGTIVLAGGVIGLIAAILVFFGNPANMGFCIACFLRDTTGALGLHSAAAVQYIRPEIIGLVLGACIISLAKKEFRPRGGSAPVTRFTTWCICYDRMSDVPRMSIPYDPCVWHGGDGKCIVWTCWICSRYSYRNCFPEERLHTETFL